MSGIGNESKFSLVFNSLRSKQKRRLVDESGRFTSTMGLDHWLEDFSIMPRCSMESLSSLTFLAVRAENFLTLALIGLPSSVGMDITQFGIWPTGSVVALTNICRASNRVFLRCVEVRCERWVRFKVASILLNLIPLSASSVA